LHVVGKHALILGMLKSEAIEKLGGTIALAAERVGVTPQAVSQWPETLPARIADRVQAALWRMSQRKQPAKA
jgi:DNA-binding transcriptional regulator YdaS (Cro superfamily)